MRIAIYQNKAFTNTKKITNLIRQGVIEAIHANVDVVIFPELISIPDNIIEQHEIANTILRFLQTINNQITVIYGGIKKYNDMPSSAAFIVDRYEIRTVIKNLLSKWPSFNPYTHYISQQVNSYINIHTQYGIKHCDILLGDVCNVKQDILSQLQGDGPVLIISAIPYYIGKIPLIQKSVEYVASKTNRPVVLCNQNGIYNHAVMSGGSIVADTSFSIKANLFSDDVIIVDLPLTSNVNKIDYQLSNSNVKPEDIEQWYLYNALKLYIMNIYHDTSVDNVIIDMSHIVNGSLLSIIAADCLGGDQVIGAMFEDNQYIRHLAKNIRIPLLDINIVDDIYALFTDSLLSGSKQNLFNDTVENLRKRCRELILLTLCDEYNALLLSNDDKTHMYTMNNVSISPLADLNYDDISKLLQFAQNYKQLISYDNIQTNNIDNDQAILFVMEKKGNISELIRKFKLTKKEIDKITKDVIMLDRLRKKLVFPIIKSESFN